MVNMGPDAEPAPFRIDDHDFERMLAQVPGAALHGRVFRAGGFTLGYVRSARA